MNSKLFMKVCRCDLTSLNLLSCVTMCDACVTSTDASEAYKVALGTGFSSLRLKLAREAD